METHCRDPQIFAGQNWKGRDFYPDDSPSRILVDNCLKKANWDELCSYASALNNGSKCCVLPSITNGLYHLVRLLEFDNKTRWVARIQMAKSTQKLAKILQGEVDAMALMRERTNIPVPKVFGYKTDDKNPIGVAFMLMEFLPGNVAIDADGGYESHRGKIPHQYKERFYKAVAQVQVQMTSVRFPKIGTIVKCEDGSYDIGPFPDIGGPFETTAAFFAAWAAHAKFPKPRDEIQRSVKNDIMNEMLSSIEEFPSKLKTIADRFTSCGSYPVWHPDFFHSNIVVNNRYNILGVIDWEGACTVPWELVELPLFLETVPFLMDASWNYDEKGQPLDEVTRQIWREREEYVEMVARFEDYEQVDHRLSTTLHNENFQSLAYAVRVYLNPGKLGFYHKVLEPFH